MDAIEASGIEIKKVTIVGHRPPRAHDGDHIYNAPRPLYGHRDWIGDFVTGVFFVAVDPDGERALDMVERNRQLDARELVYITEDEFKSCVAAYGEQVAAEYGVDLDEFSYEDIVSSYVNHEANEGRRILVRT